MSPFFDDLEAQLRSAAQATAGAQAAQRPRRLQRPRQLQRPRRFRRLGRPTRDAAAVLAAVAVVVVVVVAAVALLGHGGRQSPQPPPSPPTGGGIGGLVAKTPPRQLKRELAYITAATRGVLRSPVCRVAQPNNLTFTHGSPGRALMSVLGVLRRPQRAFDQPNWSALGDGPDKIYAGHARRALVSGGVAYYVVPARSDPAAVFPSDRCLELQVAALQRHLPTVPARLRQPTRALEGQLVAENRRLSSAAPQDTVCLLAIAGSSSGASCGITVQQIRDGLLPQNDQGTFYGLVPDGVASVTLNFSAARGRPAHSVSARVISNVYAVRLSATAPPAAEPTVIWRTAAGQAIKTVSVASAQALAKQCQGQPAACAVGYGYASSRMQARAKPAPAYQR